MEYVIASYRSRNVTMKVYNYLINNGVVCAIVSTPRSANVGCGLSVKISTNTFLQLRNTLAELETFAGFFRVRNVGGSTIVTRV